MLRIRFTRSLISVTNRVMKQLRKLRTGSVFINSLICAVAKIRKENKKKKTRILHEPTKSAESTKVERGGPPMSHVLAASDATTLERRRFLIISTDYMSLIK